MDITNDLGQLETIKVYEDTIEGTAEMYVRRMSKHLANTTYFPEWTGMGSKHKIHKGTRSDIVSLAEEKSIATYSNLAVERQLGFDRNAREQLASPIYKGLGVVASTSAAIGLSSPLSGLKNLAIGIPRAMTVHGFWRTLRGLGKVFDATAWNDARRRGALEYGAKTLELSEKGWGRANVRNLFKYVNFMTGTENIN